MVDALLFTIIITSKPKQNDICMNDNYPRSPELHFKIIVYLTIYYLFQQLMLNC